MDVSRGAYILNPVPIGKRHIHFTQMVHYTLFLMNLHSMYYYGVVACSSLNFGHLVNDSAQCVYVTTPTICCPVSDLELADMMRLTKLKKNSKL